MKLIIDIDKKEYNKIYTMVHDNLMEFLGVPKSVDVAIANGIPLPKGHGRLIDADKLFEEDKRDWLCIQNAPFISTAHVFAEIDHAPTIIEADKAESEGT